MIAAQRETLEEELTALSEQLSHSKLKPSKITAALARHTVVARPLLVGISVKTWFKHRIQSETGSVVLSGHLVFFFFFLI